MKHLVRRAFSSLGYRIIREATPTPAVDFANFHGLVEAYEQLLNESHGEEIIPASESRAKLMARLTGTRPAEAYFIVASLAKTAHLEGDVCEFGVAQGETSALIASEILTSGKRFHIFDSFEGLPKPTDQDRLKDDIASLGSMEAYEGRMSYPREIVEARLRAVSFPAERTVIHPGFVEKTLQEDQTLPQRISFAYLDFDFYEPIKVTLEYMHEVLSPGGIVVVDDYDYFSTGGKTAVDEFVEAKNAAGKVYDMHVPDKRYGCFAVLTMKAAS